jgi:hypothetical protein
MRTEVGQEKQARYRAQDDKIEIKTPYYLKTFLEP